jgi:tRNA (guanine37-N1)-methyltransferase
MKLDFVTLFPRMFEPWLAEGILSRACKAGIFDAGFANPRDFSRDKHRSVDDRPFGGGAGMIMMAEPMRAAIKSVSGKHGHVVFLSPQGKRFIQADARRLSREKHLVLVCGRYEGIDERLMPLFDEELSVGDYVLSGGELPAMIVADAVLRLLPGVLKKSDAAACESFEGAGLDFPQYTRPRIWRGRKVPTALVSGDHQKIAAFRRRAAEKATRLKRPDLLGAVS